MHTFCASIGTDDDDDAPAPDDDDIRLADEIDRLIGDQTPAPAPPGRPGTP